MTDALKKRDALIIGGTGALGSAVARDLLQEGYGVVLAARSSARLAEMRTLLVDRSEGRARVGTVPVDLEVKESVIECIDHMGGDGLRPAILINCAAGFYKGAFGDIETDALTRLLAANFGNVVLLVRRFIAAAKDEPLIDIVNVTSIAAATTLDISRSSTAHIASKAALHVFDAVLARELNERSVRVTSVAPSTLAKTGRSGVDVDVLARMIRWIVELPASVRVESLVVQGRAGA